MRGPRGLLFTLVLLASAPALAESSPSGDAAPAPAPAPAKERATVPAYRLVRILPETHQALLLDKKKGKHVVVDVGDTLGASGFEVSEIGEDHVVLARAGEAREFVLVAGDATPNPRLVDPYAMPNPDAPAAPSPAPAPASKLLDPYGGVMDPYGSDGVREVQAPTGQRASETPPPAPPPPKADPVKPPKANPAPAPAKADPPAPAPVKTDFTVSRGQLDAALSDFAAIARDVDMVLGDAGVTLRKVAPASFFATMGLHDGDVVTKVNGTAIRGLDDAARVYARLGKAKKFTVELVRAGAPLTLRYQITK